MAQQEPWFEDTHRKYKRYFQYIDNDPTDRKLEIAGSTDGGKMYVAIWEGQGIGGYAMINGNFASDDFIDAMCVMFNLRRN